MVNTLKFIVLTSFLFRVLLYLTICCFSSPLRWAFGKNWLPAYFGLLPIMMTEHLKLRCTKMHRYLSSHRYGSRDVVIVFMLLHPQGRNPFKRSIPPYLNTSNKCLLKKFQWKSSLTCFQRSKHSKCTTFPMILIWYIVLILLNNVLSSNQECWNIKDGLTLLLPFSIWHYNLRSTYSIYISVVIYF